MTFPGEYKWGGDTGSRPRLAHCYLPALQSLRWGEESESTLLVKLGLRDFCLAEPVSDLVRVMLRRGCSTERVRLYVVQKDSS